MKERLKGRQDLIDKLIPTNFAVGCRRPTVWQMEILFLVKDFTDFTFFSREMGF
jgi:hypothetical protein